MKFDYKSFKKFIAQKVEESGGQTKIAKGIGVSQPVISRWISSERFPSFESFEKVCEYFDLTKEDIYRFYK